MRRRNILFLCTGNSCRSQMAEGLLRHYKGDQFSVYSAGTKPQTLNELAVKVMREIGIDISSHKSKHLEELKSIAFDCVVTVCDSAKEQCPLWLGKGRVIHHSFEDPPVLAAGSKTEQEALAHYRRVRDEIRNFIQTLPDTLEKINND